MKTAYLFDIDLIERKRYPQFPKLPNHALMKLSSYFKIKGYKVKLIYHKKYIPIKYSSKNKYIASALYSGNLERFKQRINKYNINPKFNLELKHIKIGTPSDTCPITDLEGLKCDYTEYDKMIKKDGIKLNWYPSNIGFLTRGCKRHCDFCVNRDKSEITRVNNINDIYQKKGQPIYLLDDNLFASDDAVELFNQIALFGKENPEVTISLQNGVDCRVMPIDKIKALKRAKKYLGTIHIAWDNVKHTHIFKNMLKLRRYGINGCFCYLLLGSEVYNDEDFKKDVLAFFYRYLQLEKIDFHPVNQLYEDDRENGYKNPYWNLYTVLVRQYNFTKHGRYLTIYRTLPPNYKPLADKIVELLGEFHWVITEPIGNIKHSKYFDEKMKSIADYLEIKHVTIPRELYATQTVKKKE